nr:DUF2269 domain-containing protein [Coxiellaceae bacterium]
MTWYDALKIIHVISAAILFGTGLGTAFYMLLVNRQKDTTLIAQATRQVVFADWLFTGTSGVVQATTGLAMIYVKGYSFHLLWVWGSISGYLIAGACWLPVVWLQMRCRDLALAASESQQPLPAVYHRYFTTWWILGIPAFLALLLVFFLMSSKVTF